MIDGDLAQWKVTLDQLADNSNSLDSFFGQYKFMYGIYLIILETVTEMVRLRSHFRSNK
jgi:ATP/ADP translocase